MVWMTSFCFCCTIRLGVIVSALFSLVVQSGFLLIFAFYGVEVFSNIVTTLENDPELKDNFILRQISKFIKLNIKQFIIFCIVDSSVYIVACLLCVYGTYKLKKWFLLPYMIIQLIYVIKTLSIHIITMLVIKKDINLGFLIGLTIVGGFIVLIFGYQWSGSVGMFLIIQLVISPKYKNLYGEDPFYPIDLMLSGDMDSVENIKIFTTPNYDDDIKNLKTFNSMAGIQQKLNADLYPMNQFKNISSNGYYNYNYSKNDTDSRNFWHINELVGFRRFNNRIDINPVGYY